MAARTQQFDSGGGLGVSPNPAQSGATLTITAPSGTTVSVVLIGVGTTKLVIGRDGKAAFKIPAGFDGTILVSDRAFPRPNAIKVDVVAFVGSPFKGQDG